MKYHDYYLESYTVSNGGETIIFQLTLDLSNKEKSISNITFSNVSLYNFINTTGTIITNIEEIPVEKFIPKIAAQITEWHRMYGVKHWKLDVANYISDLQNNNFKVWEITSAIGFYGFVIAKDISNI